MLRRRRHRIISYLLLFAAAALIPLSTLTGEPGLVFLAVPMAIALLVTALIRLRRPRRVRLPRRKIFSK